MRAIKKILIYIFFSLLRFLRALRENLLHHDKSRVVILDAPYKFHFQHIYPLLIALKTDNRIKLIVTKWQDFNSSDEITDVEYLEHCELDNRKFYLYDCFITTEYKRMFWWFDGNIRTGFLLHGVGPKASYIKNDELNRFSFILSPGPKIHKLQEEVVDNKEKLKKIGLPITDALINSLDKIDITANYFSKVLPVILYAPSWSSEPELISMDDSILCALKSQDKFNVIIRPHPLLLQPEKCGGKDYRTVLLEGPKENVYIDMNTSQSIYTLFKVSDLLISDISSVLYEFMLTGKPICIYKKSELFSMYQSSEAFEELSNAVTVIDNVNTLEDVISAELASPEEHDGEREIFVKKIFYNPGRATETAVEEIYRQINLAMH
jgi:CDP-glycerol glycerophosphotransferase (TagB/SpsB family)